MAKAKSKVSKGKALDVLPQEGSKLTTGARTLGKYEVSLQGMPSCIVEGAASPTEAIQQYNTYMGIISTDHTHVATPLDDDGKKVTPDASQHI
jgi:hypothetical protein